MTWIGRTEEGPNCLRQRRSARCARLYRPAAAAAMTHCRRCGNGCTSCLFPRSSIGRDGHPENGGFRPWYCRAGCERVGRCAPTSRCAWTRPSVASRPLPMSTSRQAHRHPGVCRRAARNQQRARPRHHRRVKTSCTGMLPQRGAGASPRLAKLDHDWIREIRPYSVSLFRYSALAFNGTAFIRTSHMRRKLKAILD
jgi:hypothetical protein